MENEFDSLFFCLCEMVGEEKGVRLEARAA